MAHEFKSSTLPIRFNDVEPGEEGTEYFDVKFSADFGSIKKGEVFCNVSVTDDGEIICRDEEGNKIKSQKYQIIPK